jgi:hypothetical protein
MPDPKTATKERGGKKSVVLPFFVVTNIYKIVNYFNFEKISASLHLSLFTLSVI